MNRKPIASANVHLKSEVDAGSSFARALATAPREFDDSYRAVVAAGEQSGALGIVLDKLADDLRQQRALRTEVRGALLHPAMVSLVAFTIVIVLVLVTWVVPQIAGTFARPKRALLLLTVAMLGISAISTISIISAITGFVRQCGWAVAAQAVGGLVMFSWRGAPALFASAATPPSCACRSSAAWRAATTRRALAARWPRWRGPACRS